MRIDGQGGSCRVGYQQAASLGRWTLTGDPAKGYAVTAELVTQDAFWWAQRPMQIALSMGNRHWVWSVDPVGLGSSITVALSGAPLIT